MSDREILVTYVDLPQHGRRKHSRPTLTLSMLRGTDSSFQLVPSMTIVLFIVTALPCQVGL